MYLESPSQEMPDYVTVWIIDALIVVNPCSHNESYSQLQEGHTLLLPVIMNAHVCMYL